MVALTPDPTNPDRLVLTLTTTLYLDRLLTDVLSAEVADAIRARAIKDLKSNAAVKQQIAIAATNKLLEMLGAKPEEMKNE